MNRIANPWNIHALYTDQLWEHTVHCPLYCGTANLPGTQLKLSTSTSASTYAGYIVNPDTGYSLDVTAQMSRVNTTVATFYRFAGSSLSPVLDEGSYQLKLEVGNSVYWGHTYCALDPFNTNYRPVGLINSTGGAGDYAFTFSVSNPKDSYGYKWEYDAGSGWVEFGLSSGTLTEEELGTTGTVTIELRVWAYMGNESAYRKYDFTFDTSDPLGTIDLSQTGDGGDGLNKHARLVWKNTNDLQNLGLLYSTPYFQFFYFMPEIAFPTPVLEDNFVQNGEAGLFLESAIIADQINIDCYPVPGELAHVLNSIRLHDYIALQAIWDQATETLTNFQFTPSNVEGALCQTGRFSFERNRAYVGGCAEDYTTV